MHLVIRSIDLRIYLVRGLRQSTFKFSNRSWTLRRRDSNVRSTLADRARRELHSIQENYTRRKHITHQYKTLSRHGRCSHSRMNFHKWNGKRIIRFNFSTSLTLRHKWKRRFNWDISLADEMVASHSSSNLKHEGRELTLTMEKMCIDCFWLWITAF